MLKEVAQKKPDEIWIYRSFSARDQKHYPQTVIPVAMIAEHEAQLMCNHFITVESLEQGGCGLYSFQAVAVLSDRREERVMPDASDSFSMLNKMVEDWEKNHKPTVAV